MRTVKELAVLTGISTRTLHYYDEIGLLPPSDKNEAGYRLYDDKALEVLQQILYFKEFDVPLKEIERVINNPNLDRNQILRMQREMLLAKRNRLNRLIANLDGILEGDNTMDFTIFNETEISDMFQAMLDHMPEPIKKTAIDKFGSEEKWREHYFEVVSSEDYQKKAAKIIEWYGGKENYINAQKNPVSKELMASYLERERQIRQKLIDKKECPIDSFEVKSIIGEYGFAMKMMLQLQEEKELMLSIADNYRSDKVKSVIDSEYGEGAAEYFAKAIEIFYK